MDLTKFNKLKSSTNFYINQIMNGRQIKNEVRLTFNTSKDKPNQVLINNNVPAYINISENQYLDELEIIANELANLFDVEVAPVFKLTNESEDMAVICKGVNNQNELLIGMDYVFQKLYEKIKYGFHPRNNWLENFRQIPANDPSTPIDNPEHLKSLIDLGINAANEAFTIKESTPNEFTKKYLTMLIFDFLINQTHRNAKDYHIIVDKSSKSARLAPLFNNNKISLEKISTYSFNNRLTNRYSLIKTIYANYYEHIKELSRCITNHQSAYLKSVKLICEYNTDKTHAQQLLTNIKENIAYLTKMELETSGANEYENKVDLTQTTIRINQIVMKKNLLIQNKFPEKNEKNTTQSKEEETKDNRLKISCEEPEKPKKISKLILCTSIIIGIFALALIAGTIIAFLNK